MTIYEKSALFFLRVATGWLMFYAGITKVLDPEWSAAGYLQNAGMFTDFYQWMALSSLLPVVNFANEWGLTLLGLSLMVGAFVRLSSLLGAVLMLLYYFPAVHMQPFALFPSVTLPHTQTSVLVDNHIIYAAVLLLLAAFRAGRVWGLEKYFARGRAWLG